MTPALGTRNGGAEGKSGLGLASDLNKRTVGAMEGAGAVAVPWRAVTSDSPSPPQLGPPHPSIQAGNHTLGLGGQGTNSGRKGLLTAAKKQTIPKAL